MRQAILFFLCIIIKPAFSDGDMFAQFCTSSNRFTERPFFSESEIASTLNVVYAVVDSQELQMDFFYPDSTVETIQKRPFIMMIHGGSFTGGLRRHVQAACEGFARRGFVAATISYRLSAEGNIPAQYKAAQDAHAALRYVVEHAAQYKIDTSWIFVGGNSAGAMIANGLVYIDQREWQSRDTLTNLVSAYGRLYSSGNQHPNSYDIKGVFNNWGSVYLPGVDSNEVVPTISFHGERDPVIDIGLNRSNFTGGANVIDSFLKRLACCSEVVNDSLAYHGVYLSPSGIDFRVSKATCFFKSVFCGTCLNSYSYDSVYADCSLNTSIKRNEAFSGLTAFPNPFSNHVRILNLDALANFLLIDSYGRELANERDLKRMMWGDLKPGVYFLLVSTENRQETIKLLKQR